MTPDDPRHGSSAGYLAETKAGVPHCQPCRDARARYQRWREYDKALGRPRKMPALGARRRVRALQRLGWSLSMIASDAGWNSPEALQYVMKSETVTRRSWERINASYERLSMKLPPFCSATVRARLRAERLGYPPPLAWDCIDTDPEPRGAGYRATRSRDEYDEVVVLRILAGDKVRANRNEYVEALRRWKAEGGTEADFCKRLGLKEGRYGRDRAA